MKIGFCGLGRMGGAMVGRLLGAGHSVAVWNRTPPKAAAAIEAGARLVATPAAAAADCDLAILCLLDAVAVERVVFGSDGIAGAGQAGVLVDHSSISPVATRGFAARLADQAGTDWLDAPVSGGVPGARTGTLTVMAGGTPQSLEAARPALAAYAAQVVHVGPVGAGQTFKLCNQAIVAATLVAIGEAVALAKQSGIDPALLPKALAGGWADSKLLQTIAPRMSALPADVIGSLSTLLKDAEAVSALAAPPQVPMPVGAAVLQTLRLAIARGWGDSDLSQVARLFEPL